MLWERWWPVAVLSQANRSTKKSSYWEDMEMRELAKPISWRRAKVRARTQSFNLKHA